MILLWIILIVIIVIIIERIIVCSKKYIIINPQKINKLKIDNNECYLLSSDVYKISKNNKIIEIEKDNKKISLKGDYEIYNVPTHVSEKLKTLSFNKHLPVNSLCSVWDCYTNVASGNIMGNYKIISPKRINNLCICNEKLYF